MTSDVTRAIPMQSWLELGSAKAINDGKYKKMEADSAGAKAAKIITMAGGIALFFAKTAPYGGPEGLKNKVEFGMLCLMSSSVLYNAMFISKKNLKQIREEGEIKNA